MGWRASEQVDDLDVLWQPLTVGAVTAPNRIAVSAHGTGMRGEQYAEYLAERARGGAGLIVTGATAVDPTSDIGLTWRGWERASIAEIRAAARAVHRHERPLIVQLYHAGSHDTGLRPGHEGDLLLAPSAVPSPVYGVIPKAMERVDIERIIEAFVVSARHVLEAGADGVEIHAAHGYLLCEFLSPLTNTRSDEYGGSVENRARVVLEIGREIRQVAGEGFVIGVKVNFDEFVGRAGITPSDAVATVRVVHAAGLFDYFSISCGNYHSFHYLVAPYSSGLASHTAAYGTIAREAVRFEVPVIVTGTVRRVEQAAEIVRLGQADMVGMIRAHIADPEIVRKAQSGRAAEIRHCVGANQGCWRRLMKAGHVRCTVNPTTGHERSWGTAAEAKTPSPRKVLVVGGGPAGLKLAETAASRGHQVTLVERNSELGGQIRWAGMLPRRESWLQLVDDLTRSLERLGVSCRLDTEMTATSAGAFAADAMFVATGSTWDTSGFSATRPEPSKVPRAEGSCVLDPITAIADPEACGERVVIVDESGAYLPLGLAERLALQGRHVAIVTPHLSVGRTLGPDSTVDLAWIYPRLVAAGVSIHTASHVTRIEPGRTSVSPIWGEGSVEVPADSVVFCALRSSDDRLYHELRAQDLPVRRVGDCVAPREVDDAILDGVREGNSL
jgi:2,4-dienoyl-CoA reductase-like NADH-dependent reductase (Old Yellow Enzyme family)